jgi:hypothetical protein
VCGGKFDKVSVMLRENFDLDKAVAEHLRHNYGTRALPLAKMAFEEKDLIVEVRRGGCRAATGGAVYPTSECPACTEKGGGGCRAADSRRWGGTL